MFVYLFFYIYIILLLLFIYLIYIMYWLSHLFLKKQIYNNLYIIVIIIIDIIKVMPQVIKFPKLLNGLPNPNFNENLPKLFF